MSDPRNVAHKKKVTQEKQHKKAAPAAAEKKPATEPGSAPPGTDAAKDEHAAGDLEKSLAILSKLKEMEFHSRANIETLAGLTLSIEEELKQPEFSDPIGEIYSAQANFESKVAAFIEIYSAKCESLKGSA